MEVNYLLVADPAASARLGPRNCWKTSLRMIIYKPLVSNIGSNFSGPIKQTFICSILVLALHAPTSNTSTELVELEFNWCTMLCIADDL